MHLRKRLAVYLTSDEYERVRRAAGSESMANFARYNYLRLDLLRLTTAFPGTRPILR